MWELRKNFDTLDEAGLHRIADDFFHHAEQTLDFSSVRDLCGQACIFLEEYCQQQDLYPLRAEYTFPQAVLSLSLIHIYLLLTFCEGYSGYFFLKLLLLYCTGQVK